MNARDFLNFFKTRTGRLLLFAAVFAGVLVLFGVFRRHGGESDIAVKLLPKDASSTNDKPQLVQTVERPMEVFRPPPPKPEPVLTRTNIVVVSPPTTNPMASTPPQQLPPIALFAETPVREPRTLSPNYAPYGRLIPCETVITVDSASIQTPIIGFVTEDIYHAGRLIIPASTEVHGTAKTDRSRERIASGNSWTLVWQTGEEMRLNAIALDREFDNGTNQTGWGITDGSAGLRGRVIKTDDLAEIKLFAATFLSGAAGALTDKEQTIFGTIDSPSLNNAPFKGAQDVLKVYSQRILESIQRDGFYVRVPSGKQFYLYVVQTIDRADARVGGGAEAIAQSVDALADSNSGTDSDSQPPSQPIKQPRMTP